MRTISYTGQFKRDYKREKSAQARGKFDAPLLPLVDALATDETLPARHCDHALTSDWKDHRDCHVRPDPVLIYRKPRPDSLQLVRLGSHSELGW